METTVKKEVVSSYTVKLPLNKKAVIQKVKLLMQQDGKKATLNDALLKIIAFYEENNTTKLADI